MRLQFPFIQLPLRFDASALAAELAVLTEAEWRPHPQGFAGNSALPLVAVNGDPDNDGLVGPMRPTPFLARFPYLQRVLGSFGAVLGRTRLMRLSGQAEVQPHIDQAYYWTERMRVHVPIVTQPGVRFYCGDADINMAAGECWIFDTWRLHRVHNNGDDMRIHLVADTVGGDGFWNLMTRSRPHHVGMQGWSVDDIAPRADAPPELQFESVNTPRVMTPWELHSHLAFLFGELKPSALIQDAQQRTLRFMRSWQAAWSQFGDAEQGRPDFRRLLDAYTAEMARYKGQMALRNELDFHKVLTIMVLVSALSDKATPVVFGEPRDAPGKAPAPRARDAEFDRPVFIVSPPRSGSTLLFETLTQAQNVYTIGDESHGLIEGVQVLHPSAGGFESNRLDARVAGSDVAAHLRGRFRAALIDRNGTPPSAFPLRMLEKTPKNSLRIPFLTRVFPEAHFIYLHRDVRAVLASMIEAWTSGRFRTYPTLPGWSGPPWSLVLTPGWRELVGKPLHEIVAAQWQATTQVLLDDLAQLPPERVHVARYDALLADPAAEIARLCTSVDFVWDRALDAQLPLSRYTTSKPDPDKWRRHETQIQALLPGLRETIARSEAMAAR
jgi:hypothetical protein